MNLTSLELIGWTRYLISKCSLTFFNCPYLL